MRRIPLASLILLAGFVRAAEVAPSATPPRSGSIEASAGVETTKAPAKPSVSPATAAKLAAASPKFIVPAGDPAPADPPAPAEIPASPVSREPDKSRNQIIQLPEFVVGEPKERVPSPLQVLTPKGRVELAFIRYPGLRIVPFGWMNAGVALELLEDDLQAQRRKEAAELLSLYLIR